MTLKFVIQYVCHCIAGTFTKVDGPRWPLLLLYRLKTALFVPFCIVLYFHSYVAVRLQLHSHEALSLLEYTPMMQEAKEGCDGITVRETREPKAAPT